MHPTLHAALAVALALLFAGSARHKWRDGQIFRAQLAEYRLLPRVAVGLVARLLMGSELAVSLALLLPQLRARALLAGAALLVLYAAAVAVNLLRGRRRIDCGCAGRAAQGISWWMVARNGAVAASAGLLAVLPVAPLPDAPYWADAVLAGATLLACLFAWLLVDQLIANHTRLRDGGATGRA